MITARSVKVMLPIASNICHLSWRRQLWSLWAQGAHGGGAEDRGRRDRRGRGPQHVGTEPEAGNVAEQGQLGPR